MKPTERLAWEWLRDQPDESSMFDQAASLMCLLDRVQAEAVAEGERREAAMERRAEAAEKRVGELEAALYAETGGCLRKTYT